MAGRVTIGEFSTMTRLSRKALRHYHDLGLLTPAEVDANTGYRYYDSTQIELARVIRRFRDLDMPVAEVKAYVAAADEAARAQILAAHLDRMQAQLRQTEDAIASLRDLLAPADTRPLIEIRSAPAEIGVAVTETVRRDDVLRWWHASTRELDDALRAAGVDASGPLSAFFEHALFADDIGEVTLWFPVAEPVPVGGRVRMADIHRGRFAVAVHDGPDARIDETYAALGTYVSERGIGAAGPVRERYLAGILGDPAPLITEIGWPITGDF